MRRTGGGDDHIIFAAQAEFAGNVNAGLVRKGHARGKHSSAGTNQVGVFVPVKANAMAKTMGEKLVIGAVTGGGNDGASSVIDRTGEFTRTSRVKGGVLGLANDFKNLLNFG